MTELPKSELPESEWAGVRNLARVAWKRIVLSDLERTQQQMEDAHSSEKPLPHPFNEICDFERKQSGWYFEAFAGACPARAVFDAFSEGVLTADDFSDASPALVAARDRYISTFVDPRGLGRLNIPLMESLDREKRNLYLD